LIEFKLDPKSGVPFYRQIIDQIRFGISAGKLKVGEQLPTVRALAVELKVNLNTISKAYKELEIKQILESQQGTGTFIGTSELDISQKERNEKVKSICSEFISIASAYGLKIGELIKELERKKNEN